jgi:peptidyl-dipeptidase Dcp
MLKRVAVGLVIVVAAVVPGRARKPEAAVPQANPLLGAWSTPFGVPPFQDIKPEHFLPALESTIEAQRGEVRAIAAEVAAPTFANTVEALEESGVALGRVRGVFSNLSSAETNDRLQAINLKIAPLLSALDDDIRLDPKLFARIKAVWEQRERAGLTAVQRRLLDETYRDFARNGANLDEAGKTRLRAINAELAQLSVTFDQHLLHETNAFQLLIDKQADLSGLPSTVVAGAAEAAAAAGMAGKWVFTLHAPSIWPFLQHADNRELRRQILRAYASRGDHGDEWDNKRTLARIAVLRLDRSRLLGYASYADFALEEAMAKTPARVYDLLGRLWTPARAMALKEAAALQALGAEKDAAFRLEPADWRYHTEKIRKARYDLDAEAVRPYFPLDAVRDGAFEVAHRLYGITLSRRADLPVYHPDVQAFEVKDGDGSHLGVLYMDFFPRPGKNGGAWQDTFRPQWVMRGKEVRPVVTTVFNFPRPTSDAPSLLSLEEAETVFHEFGHALHTLLSKVPYRTLGNVPTDFVELPSQIMENWASEPAVLALYARHYKTGETIPAALVEKIKKAQKFNQGFTTVEYLAASLLDMDWHTRAVTGGDDPAAFEQASLTRMQLLPEILVRYRSPYFSHVFGENGALYAAGYYSYIWSEVLDKDAFEAFKERGLFDQPTARAFRTLLEKGGTEEAMALYKAFRGREPGVEPLLKARGLM